MLSSKHAAGLAFAAAIMVGGCSSSSDSGAGGSSMDDLANQASAQRTADEQAAEEARKAEEARQAAAAAAQPSAEPERKVAQRDGVGEGGYYTAIVGARRHVLNKVDDLAWTQAVQHFQATNGRLPKNHEEFMSEIIIPLEIDLGFKEDNQEFLYDPTQGDWGEVYVVEKLDPAAAPQQ